MQDFVDLVLSSLSLSKGDLSLFMDLVVVGLSIGMVYGLIALSISLVFSGLDIVDRKSTRLNSSH